MADDELVALLKVDRDAWNRWRQEPSQLRPELSRAELSDANPRDANLREVDLRDVNLSRADLHDANLRGANLRDVKLSRTVFGNVDLTEAIDLDQCNHAGPSIIDLQTFQRSGPLPLAFLRGVGLPSNVIE